MMPTSRNPDSPPFASSLARIDPAAATRVVLTPEDTRDKIASDELMAPGYLVKAMTNGARRLTGGRCEMA
jgi:hypothetical protein